jgi:hypothetical protein
METPEAVRQLEQNVIPNPDPVVEHKNEEAQPDNDANVNEVDEADGFGPAVPENGKKRRYFKCVYNGEVKGRYANFQPFQAAKKAFTTIVRGRQDLIGVPIRFGLVECTQGNRKKRWTYQGTRLLREKPAEIEIMSRGKPLRLTYKYENKLFRIPGGGNPANVDNVVNPVNADNAANQA